MTTLHSIHKCKVPFRHINSGEQYLLEALIEFNEFSEVYTAAYSHYEIRAKGAGCYPPSTHFSRAYSLEEAVENVEKYARRLAGAYEVLGT